MSAWRWDELPSPDHLSSMQIHLYRVPTKGEAYVRLLALPRWLWTHYVRGRTYPCRKQRDRCLHCADVLAQLKGYSPALVWLQAEKTGKGEWQQKIFEVTERCLDLRDRPELLALALHFRRHGKRPQGPLSWQVASDRVQAVPYPLIEPFDMMPTLERVFEEPGRHLRPATAADLAAGELPRSEEPAQASSSRPPRLTEEERARFRQQAGLDPHTNGTHAR